MLMRRLQRQPRRNCARVGAHHIALMVDVLNAERGIDGRLVGIGRGSAEIIETKRAKNWSLAENLWSRRSENWSASVATFDAVA